MRITRFLLPGFVVALGVGPAVAQPAPGAFGDYSSLVPSVRPAAAEEPELPPQPPAPRTPVGVTSLQQMQAPVARPGPGAGPAGWLTGDPGAQPGGQPPGSYPSPYYVDGPGCCGPLGRDGRIGYELYSYAGLNFTFGNGLPDRLNAAGWTVGGGVRTLFFDPTHTAAWTVDFGGSFTYNRGQGAQEPTNLFRRQPTAADANNVQQPQPDVLTLSGVRGIHRSSFNYAIGRDWWLLGDGSTGGQNGTNWRVGGWIGGRYGTMHLDAIPLNEVGGYFRRQNVFHGIYAGVHTTFDVPMGAWVWTNGIRAEYGHDWNNVAPPIQGNLHNINVQFTTGIRY